MRDEAEAALAELRTASLAYTNLKATRQAVMTKLWEATIAALKAGVPPTEVTANCPYTSTRVRQLAREAGLPPGRPGPKKGYKRTYNS